MQELGPDALDAIPAVAGDAVRRPLDAHQALDIEMQQVAGSSVFIAIGRQLRFDIADAAQLQPPQHAADRGRAEPKLLGDPHPGPTLPSQPLDLHDPLLRRAAWRPMRSRTAVSQPGHALIAIAPNPLGCTLPAELELGHGLVQAQPAL